jgi:signal transduction histidine kinase
VVEGGAPEHAPTLVSGLIDVVSRAQLAAGGLAIELQVGRIEQELPRELVRPVATAAEEALANVRKHAHAERAIVACEVIGDCARVTVRDDGVGFEPAHAELGSGLRFSILKRLLMCGGSARVQSRPGEGAVVTLEVRLKPTTTPAAG